MPGFTPVNQVRLTNVAIVRYKRKGKRFEIACYPNKVMDWRNQIEKSLDEVVQTTTIFSNVSKGTVAKMNDVKNAFDTTDEEEACRIILQKGSLQVSKKERQAESDNKFRDIATIVAEKCVDSETKRPFSVTMITEAMKEAHVSVKPNKTAKQQALEVIQTLKAVLTTLERAQMRVRLEVPKKAGKELQKGLKSSANCILEEESWGSTYVVSVLLDPGAFNFVEKKLFEISKQGSLEILDMKVTESEESEL